MTIEEIAIIVHKECQAYKKNIGSSDLYSWEQIPKHFQRDLKRAVSYHLENPCAAPNLQNIEPNRTEDIILVAVVHAIAAVTRAGKENDKPAVHAPIDFSKPIDVYGRETKVVKRCQPRVGLFVMHQDLPSGLRQRAGHIVSWDDETVAIAANLGRETYFMLRSEVYAPTPEGNITIGSKPSIDFAKPIEVYGRESQAGPVSAKLIWVMNGVNVVGIAFTSDPSNGEAAALYHDVDSPLVWLNGQTSGWYLRNVVAGVKVAN